MNYFSTRTAVITSCIWLGVIASCASSQTIKTWIVVPEGFRHHTNEIDEMMSLLQAQGYRCYSAADDQVWRDELATYKACCDQKGGL